VITPESDSTMRKMLANISGEIATADMDSKRFCFRFRLAIRGGQEGPRNNKRPLRGVGPGMLSPGW
jgi:hypothetical protein